LATGNNFIPNRTFLQCLGIFLFVIVELLLESTGLRPRMLFQILQCTGQLSLPEQNYLAQNINRLRNSVLIWYSRNQGYLQSTLKFTEGFWLCSFIWSCDISLKEEEQISKYPFNWWRTGSDGGNLSKGSLMQCRH
jgi:hypothetical protein